MLEAIVGGMVGAIIPIAMGGIGFAVAWGRVQEAQRLHNERMDRIWTFVEGHDLGAMAEGVRRDHEFIVVLDAQLRSHLVSHHGV